MLLRSYRPPETAWVSSAAYLLAGGVYLSTLMWNINGSDSVYADDVGEYQVALPLWGTVHPTGTPLYMMLGSPFVTLLRWMGVSPASGASLFSLVWEAGSVALVSIILLRLTRNPLLSVLSAFVISLTRSIWTHGSIAEVYSMWVFMALLVMLLTIDLHTSWSDKKGWVLAFVAGLGLAHHRLLAPLLPIIVLWLWRHWPRGRQFWGWTSIAGLCFAAGFLPYVDMILRARSGTTWIYGTPGTWDGFWALFWASEYSTLQRPLSSGIELTSAFARTIAVMSEELGWPGSVVLMAAVPFAMERSSRRASLLFLACAVVYTVFAITIPEANFFEMAAMLSVLGLFLTAALGLHNLCKRYPGLQYPCFGGLLFLAAFYFLTNRPKIMEISRDHEGLDTIGQLDDLNAPTRATIMSPWGRHHFALAYAVQVEQRFPGWRIVHHAADLQAILESEEIIFTNSDTIYGFGLDWWTERLGTRPYLTAAGPGWVAVSTNTPTMAIDNIAYIPLDGDFLLRGWSFLQSASTFEVILCWQATHRLDLDYSTFTHLATTSVIREPSQLVASSDHATPVDGWHPTSQWLPDEIVCDAHKIQVPVQSHFNYVIAGMYTRGDDGSFHHLGSLNWERQGGHWTLSSSSRQEQ